MAYSGAAGASDLPPPSKIRDLDYGDVLFHFFQDDYFGALVRLEVSQDLGRIDHHAAEAELLAGGLYLSLGLHEEASRIFGRLLAGSVPPSVSDRAHFYLARIGYQRGYYALGPEQTPASLRPFLSEECYEVVDSLEEEDPAKVREELGDLLFQIIFHARIAEEEGRFDMADFIDGIHEKMVRRHPHVFGGASAETDTEVVANWEEIKKREKGGDEPRSALEGVPRNLPSLLRAHRLQERASRIGFDWKHLNEALPKLDEEIAEFKESLKTEDAGKIEEELGDVFFMLVNLSRFLGVNPEEALRRMHC